MADDDKGPLDKRGKGLEDEWIRRKEAEERKQKQQGSPTPDSDDEEHDDGANDGPAPHREGKNDGVKFFVWLGIAAALILIMIAIW